MELKIHVDIEVMEEVTDIPMDILDLSRILGIFLDNAIQAALETEQPSIRFALVNMDTELVFILSNTFLEKEKPYTALIKSNLSAKEANHGIGLYNVQQIIAKYNHVFLETNIQDQTFVQCLKLGRR